MIDIRIIIFVILDLIIVVLFFFLEDVKREVVVVLFVVLLIDVFNDVIENVKDFLEGEVLVVYVNNFLLWVFVFDFEDGEFVLVMNLFVVLFLVG